jgi:hypothetical protein
LRGKVEVGERPRLGQAREPRPPGEAALCGGVDLDLQQPFHRRGQRQVLRPRGVQDARQRLGGVVELGVGKVRAELLVAAGLAHRRRL